MKTSLLRAPLEVAPGIWRINLVWTQVYVLREGDDFMLVDSGTRKDRTKILQALNILHLKSTNCRGVMLTHGHCDHAGNAAYFAARGASQNTSQGALAMAHTDEIPFLETSRTYVPYGSRAATPLGAVQSVMFAGGEVFYPVRRLKIQRHLHDGDSIETPAGTWRVLHTPGHTPGHVSYFRETDGVLLSGDALLNIIPFTNRNGLSVPAPIFNSQQERVNASARRLGDLAPRILLAGHGPPLRDDTAARIRQYLATLPL